MHENWQAYTILSTNALNDIGQLGVIHLLIGFHFFTLV